MKNNELFEYVISTEELAISLALVNRPDLAKATLFEVFGELPNNVLEERLKSSSHSILARGLATIDNNGMPHLSEKFQQALAPLFLFEGMLQMVINRNTPQIINIHLGKEHQFTAHWVEQGVIHHLVFGDLVSILDWITEQSSLPEHLSEELYLLSEKIKGKIPMEIFADLPDKEFSDGVFVLTQYGLDPELAKILLKDIRQPEFRGSVSYLPFHSDQKFESENYFQPVAGVFFLKGKSSWILTFPKEEKKQNGTLLPGTKNEMRVNIQELLLKKDLAFS
ncbi:MULTISPECIES: hypothetical protein [Anaerolinea]|uniref:Uncharacterized protein n=1 Tax=Anaerolinea thermophila (strain DSM 14523 / JCM 11388 / NBRC 100420 / UNI-1) TaxID=926569 RepID=E8MZT0_ANATU|nr:MULTISPECIES: hypothetical protein [Anaerolinea]BAJ64628.1 hypothetical protein ANT_26020 [Anaerolinea thermophila UNI-1]